MMVAESASAGVASPLAMYRVEVASGYGAAVTVIVHVSGVALIVPLPVPETVYTVATYVPATVG